MFEQKSAKETILELHSSAGNGLSEAEARKRLEQNGKNELKEGKKKSVAEAFFEQLCLSPFQYEICGTRNSI